MDPREVVSRLGGAARYETLLEHGVPRHRLRAALAAGVLERPGPGVYCLPGAERHAVLAVMYRGVATCVTALHLAGLPLLARAWTCHIGVPRDRGRSATDARPTKRLVLHRFPRKALGEPGDLLPALAHAARCLPPEEWMIPVDAALHRGLITMREAVAAGRGGGLSGEWVEYIADPRAESPAETRARVQMLGAGYEVQSQVTFSGIGRVDFVVEGMVALETDGHLYHASPEAMLIDRRRDRAAVRAGRIPLRYMAQEVLAAPQLVTEDLASILGPPLLCPPAARARR